MILGLLLGNASLRFGVFDGDAIREAGRIEWSELRDRGPELASVAVVPGVTRVVAGSVRDDLLPRVEEWIPPRLLPISLARRDFPLPIESLYEKPEEAGTDRLLNAIAARARAPGRAAIAVDFGTAVSLSVVSPAGAFVGGLIAAGGRTAARGLVRAAPRLPDVDPAPPGTAIASSAGAAVSGGVFLEVAGGVSRMIRAILEEAPGASVLATGGEAALFAPFISEIEEVLPDLTLEGLLIACRSRASSPG